MSRKHKDYQEALCQDCLKPQPAAPGNVGKCDCGGDTCNCETCQQTLALLREGVRDYRTLGLQRPLESWNEVTGGVMKDLGHPVPLDDLDEGDTIIIEPNQKSNRFCYKEGKFLGFHKIGHRYKMQVGSIPDSSQVTLIGTHLMRDVYRTERAKERSEP